MAKRTSWQALLLAAVILALYARTLGYPLLIGDDNFNIRYNPFYHPLDWPHLLRAWTEPYLDLYIPVTMTAWGLPCWLAKAVPWLPRTVLLHSADLVTHWANCLLVCSLVRELLDLEQAGRPGAKPAGALAPVLAALLFAVHPLQVKNVAWITGFKDLLGTLLSLLALRMFVQAEAAARFQAGSPLSLELQARSWRQYGLATLFFTLSLLAKPSASCLPLLALVVTWIARRSWKSALPLLVPWCVMAAGVAAWTYDMQGHAAHSVPVWLRPFGALDNLAFYASKIVVPYPLAHEMTRFAVDRSESDWFWAAAALVAGALALLWRFREKDRAASGGLFLAVLAFLPVLGLVSYGHQSFSEVATHYAYLPLFGVVLSAAAVLRSLPRATSLLVCVPALAALAALTFVQVPDYSSDDALIDRIFRLEPDNGWGLNDLTVSLLRRGRLAEADKTARRLLKYPYAFQNAVDAICEAFVLGGRPDEALAFLESVHERYSDEERYRSHFALLTILAGRIEEGVGLLEDLLRAHPRVQQPDLLARSLLEDASYRGEAAAAPLREPLERAYRLDPTLGGLHELLLPHEPPQAL